MRQLFACWRLLRAVSHLFGGLWAIRRHFPGMEKSAQQRAVIAWSREMLARLGVALQVQGQAPVQGPMLLVANHISWLDIAVLHACCYCRFVSKADVRHWPILGAVATGIDTLYIERESRRDAMRVVHHIKDSLLAGDVVGIFPEGTTSDGAGVLPFHGNLLQAAISAHAPVLPVGLCYSETATGQRSTAVSYVGDESLVGSIWRTLAAPPLQVSVTFGLPQHCDGRDRRAWAADLRQAVEALRQG